MKTNIAKIIICICLVLCVLSSVTAADKKNKYQLKVTTMVFSGRRDPSFILEDEAAVKKIIELFSQSSNDAAFSKESVIPAQLGYKGMLIENFNKIAGIPDAFVIYNGSIEVLTPAADANTRAADAGVASKSRSFKKDNKNALEDYLLDQAVETKFFDTNTVNKIKKAR